MVSFDGCDGCIIYYCFDASASVTFIYNKLQLQQQDDPLDLRNHPPT